MKKKSSFYKHFKKKPADLTKKHENIESKRKESKETMLESKGYVELKSGKMVKRK